MYTIQPIYVYVCHLQPRKSSLFTGSKGNLNWKFVTVNIQIKQCIIIMKVSLMYIYINIKKILSRFEIILYSSLSNFCNSNLRSESDFLTRSDLICWLTVKLGEFTDADSEERDWKCCREKYNTLHWIFIGYY